MGTTTTPNLGLIKPDLLEKIKEELPGSPGWASQNEDNCDAIDAVFFNEADTWTPAWTSDGTNPTLGAGGSVVGRYLRLWPKLVAAWININTGGAGFNAGTSTYRLSLPFPVDPILDAMTTLEIPIGRAYLRDGTSVIDSQVAAVCYAPSTNNLFLRTEGGSWGAGSPFVPDQTDRFIMSFCYPTDAAP